jgi:hypothetical protein
VSVEVCLLGDAQLSQLRDFSHYMMCCPRPVKTNLNVGECFPVRPIERGASMPCLVGIPRQAIGLEVSSVLSLGRMKTRHRANDPVARCEKRGLTASCMQSDPFYSFKNGEATVTPENWCYCTGEVQHCQ